MGAAYHIFGKIVQPYQLSLATLGVVGLIVAPKPWGKKASNEPALNASTPEEEKFIVEYLKKVEEKH